MMMRYLTTTILLTWILTCSVVWCQEIVGEDDKTVIDGDNETISNEETTTKKLVDTTETDYFCDIIYYKDQRVVINCSNLSLTDVPDLNINVDAGAEQHLDLSHNIIKTLDLEVFDEAFNSFDNHEHITSLDLSYNPLGELDLKTSLAIGSLEQLEELFIKYCHISVVPKPLIEKLEHLHTLDLTGNLLHQVDP